jgi:Secretion system C-terminal sorting domain
VFFFLLVSVTQGQVRWQPPRTNLDCLDPFEYSYPCIKPICNTIPRRVISTNPSAPVNRERPSRVNSFNWNSTDNYPLIVPPSSLLNRGGEIVSPYAQFSFLSEDANPKDGWELLKMDLGGVNAPTGLAAIHPHIMVYNRFTGRLRIFYANGFPINGQDLKMTMEIKSDNKTSLLDFSNGVSAIAQPFQKGAFNAVSKLVLTPGYWSYADFIMNYDPCTCTVNASEITVTTSKVDKRVLSIEGTFNGRIETIANSNGYQGGENSFSFKGLAKGYVKAYSGVKEFKDNLESYIGAESAPYLDFKKILSGNNILGAGFRAVPYLKEALAIFDLFSGSTSTEPTKLAPLSIQGKINLLGRDTAIQVIEEIQFAVPGTVSTNVPNLKYPIYNETLGVFTLINQPTVIVRIAEEREIFPMNPLEDPSRWYGGTVRLHDFRLKEPIEYALNPASGLEIQEVEVSYETAPMDPTIATLLYPNGGLFTNINGESRPILSTKPLSESDFAELYTYGSVLPDFFRITLNLRRLDQAGPNVLMSLRYPVKVEFGEPANNSQSPNRFFGPISNLFGFCSRPAYKTNRINSRVVANTATIEAMQTVADANITISPNPAMDRVKVAYTALTNAPVSIYLTNSSGQEVCTIVNGTVKESVNEAFLNVGHLPNGVYFVTTVIDGTKNVQKLVLLK